ncbi:DUF2189 domain-containing protein [Hephaestia sp. GCM10023244]|uniref:DUF2189 domain-containing protein n=1 Tax=unclassified Hephaestia TaxID=2631281 RepID=UPI00207751F3|nr:DUF2189 domain-containing protein [Hephaestia sp. MAHUQ-44]MCM8730973.1 DUF2189 domain-containing protein [Hephaestia sp. MAHUQ-44]
MTTLAQSTPAPDAAETRIHQIDGDDLRWALREGWNDFRSMRGDILFAALLYPLIGLIAAAITFDSRLLPLFFPLVAGLSILGPIVSSGFYELARRREEGREANWTHFLDPLRERRRGIVELTIWLVMLFLIWLGVAWLVYDLTLGALAPADIGSFLTALFTTREGWTMIVLGNVAGAVLAAVTIATTLVAAPMVVDKAVEADSAIAVSLRATRANAGTITRWGLIVVALLVIGAIPVFIGLAVVLPVLGYATWHLYTRLVER